MDKVDYSSVTPATGTKPDNRDIAETYANQMPTADTPAKSGSFRADPDKTLPGAEAVSGVDESQEARTGADANA